MGGDCCGKFHVAHCAPERDESMNICVKTQGLTKQYPRETAVKEVCLNVPEGVVYGFLGPNGAGKTTTLKMLLGLVHPTEGEIYLFNKPMDQRNRLELLGQVGSLIESPSYYGHLTARENLEIVRTLRKLPGQAVSQALDMVRLSNTGNKPAAQFSLGMKQRLGIAAALMGRPKLLLLDEPTNGLDPAGIQEMRELIRSLPAQYGMTVVVSSHLLSEVDQLAGYVGVIRKGDLVFEDTLAALHERGARQLALRTTDNARAKALFPSAELEAETGYLLFPGLSDGFAANISLTLAKDGVGVVRLEERNKSLEDIFLDMTGKEGAL